MFDIFSLNNNVERYVPTHALNHKPPRACVVNNRACNGSFEVPIGTKLKSQFGIIYAYKYSNVVVVITDKVYFNKRLRTLFGNNL